MVAHLARSLTTSLPLTLLLLSTPLLLPPATSLAFALPHAPRADGYAVTGQYTVEGDSLANFICIGLSKDQAAGYAFYLARNEECLISEPAGAPEGILYDADCELDQDPEDPLPIAIENAKEVCDGQGGEFNDNFA